MTDTGPILPARLLEAREYVGFTCEQAAARLGCSPLLVEALERGTADPGPDMAEKLARLYRRPLAWLRGETTFQPSEDLLRKLERLGPGDREAMLDFYEFLDGAGPPPKPTGRNDG